MGVTLNKRLSFQSHADNLCEKANQRLYALNRISTFIDAPQLALTMTSFIMSHFSYCSLVLMFHDKENNK